MEFKRLVVDKLIKGGLIKFYIRDVDDTLVLAKVEDIDNIMKQFNSFDKSIRFTFDRFEDGIAHFLGIKTNGSNTNLYYKTTHTGQYCDFSSQASGKLKISWVKTLHDHATTICCSNELLNDQIKRIRTFMSWNSYPKYVRNSIKKRLQHEKTTFQKDDESVTKIWICLPYLGNKGEELVKTCISKLKRCFKSNVKSVTLHDTKKYAMFCFIKDRIPTHRISNVIFTIKCAGCSEDYVGKTDRCVIIRLNEHSNCSDQPMFQNFQHCEAFLETMTLHQLPDIDIDVSTVNLQVHITSAVSDNWKILHSNTDWVQLCFPESLYIKQSKPKINGRLKASKFLLLFRQQFHCFYYFYEFI